MDTALDLYGAAFVAASGFEPRDHPAPRIEPGLHGVAGAREGRVIRLLVTDDRGYRQLVPQVEAARQGAVTVFDRAPRSDRFLRGLSGWRADRPAVAMVLRDIHAVPAVTLPDDLVLRPVHRLASDVPDAVPLEAAVAVAIASDPGITVPADVFARFLSGLSSSVRLFAAVDDGGVVRATSGCEVFGEYARVFFVNTEPAWRRRGIGRSMTLE
ncbi:MAG: hypothetical protein ACRDLR_03080, partial [Gaiellaceae bacterium]